MPYLNAIQNVTLPMTLYGTTGKEKSRRAEELLELVGLQGRTHHKLQELSGGEQRGPLLWRWPTIPPCSWATNRPVKWTRSRRSSSTTPSAC
ncbi:MAG: hypothetical protein R2838_03350 [Caldilineaceae bacterium]